MRQHAWHSWWSTALGCCAAQAQAKVAISTLKQAWNKPGAHMPCFRQCGTIWCRGYV